MNRQGNMMENVMINTGSGTSSPLVRLLFVFLLPFVEITAATPSLGGSGSRHFHIHWNTSNPIFRIDNTDNVIDVNRNTTKLEYDQADLICPVYSPGTEDGKMEKHIIYNVSKEEYDTCRITHPDPRIIAVCDKPNKLMYFTITFRPFTPQPGGLEFLAGHDYYFISTSSQDDLHRRIDGFCRTRNMKMIFKVCCADAGTTPAYYSTTVTSPLPPPYVAVMPFPARRWPNTAPPFYHNTQGRTAATHRYPSARYPHSTSTSVSSISSSSSINRTNNNNNSNNKKSKTYNKHPNDVVKSEELTLGGTSGGGSSGTTQIFGVTNRVYLVVLLSFVYFSVQYFLNSGGLR